MATFSEHPPLPSASWDILISGSSVKQSLLAVALGRAGRSVLQIDENTYYGGNSTAFYSFSDICTWVLRVNGGHEPGFSNAIVFQEEGVDGKRGYTISLSPHLVYWHSALLRLLRSADMTDSFSWQAVGSWWVWLTDEDVAIPAATSGITLGEVGVKAAKMVAAVTGTKKKKKGGWNKGRKKEPAAEDEATGTAAAAEEKPTTLRRVAGNFREVPCTFEDVAWSADLTDRDRGHLGEFLRFVMKHDSDESTDQKYRDIFQDNRTKTLHDFISKNFPLPPSAITSLSSLTLLPAPPTKMLVGLAVPRLATHFGSLGNIPDVRSAAALTIAYGGSAELCQVFSRAAAVAGGVNVLGRGIKSVQKSEKVFNVVPKTLPEAGAEEEVKRQLDVELDNGETVHVDWIISEDATRPSTESLSDAVSIARAVYIISGPLSPIFEKKYKDESIIPAATVLMVPATREDAKPVYIIVRSAVTGECPRGQCLLYASTETSGKAGYGDIESALQRLLDNQIEPPKILFSLQYTTTSHPHSRQDSMDGIINLASVGLGMVFEDEWIEEAMAVYEKITGTTEGFMKLPDAARRMLDEMDE